MDTKDIFEKVKYAQDECRTVELLTELLRISIRLNSKGVAEDVAIYCEILNEAANRLNQKLREFNAVLD